MGWTKSPTVKRRILSLSRYHRPFHSSSSQQFFESALTATHVALEGIHSVTGLPWVASLPLSAFLIRTTFILPLSIYNRRAQQRQLSLIPLQLAWQHQIRRQVLAEGRASGPAECELRVKKAARQKRKELYKRWKCGWWKQWLPLGQLPIFLLVIETIRRMSGTHEGLLGLLVKQIRGEQTSPVDEGSEASPQILDATKSPSVGIEQSFSQEGGLWFPDLHVSDPLLLLPFILSGSMLANIYVSKPSMAGKKESVYQRRLTKSLKIFALLAGPATLQVPSAMLVYWISSSMFALGQNLLLDMFMPLKSPMPKEVPKVNNGKA